MIESALYDNVHSALERSPYLSRLSRRDVRFEHHAGRVTLRGVVGSYYQKQMAQEVIRHIAGVREIANELVVNWA
jgi:osmotically-inducible protein OsmY